MSRTRHPGWGAALVLALLAGAGWWFFARAPERRAPAAVEDPVARLRAESARAPRDIRILGALATALNNECYATRTLRGRVQPVLATSRERVLYAHEALRACDQVEGVLPTSVAAPHYRGMLYAAWGLPEEAGYALSVAVDRGDATAEARQTREVLKMLHMGGAEDRR
ncbi:MAG: hypothetical protein ABI960_04410 [Candidatus Eisenbacteria bacterium]